MFPGDITISQLQGLISMLENLPLDDLQKQKLEEIIYRLENIIGVEKSEVDEAVDDLFKE